MNVDRPMFLPTLLEGRTALVAGVDGGIGRGIVTELAASGAAVALGDLNEVGCVHHQYSST
jgi:NAD(P)-dependent dehydrogenase (short-subunit alcohol dehydrogenase family)